MKIPWGFPGNLAVRFFRDPKWVLYTGQAEKPV